MVEIPFADRFRFVQVLTPSPLPTGAATAAGQAVTNARLATLEALLSGSRRDATDKLRVSEPTGVFDSKLINGLETSVWDDQQLSGAGTSSAFNANQSSVTLAVSAAAGVRVRQSYQAMPYQAGKAARASLTAVAGAAAAGITRRWGLFNANNGVFFSLLPTGLAVNTRTFTSGVAVNIVVARAAWTGDKLDGTGPSGITLDTSKVQIWWIDLEWSGAGAVRFGVTIAGQNIVCHTMSHVNAAAVVYMTTPMLPIRFEIANDGTGAAASLVQICASYEIDGQQDLLSVSRSADAGTTVTVAAGATVTPLAAIRLRASLQAIVLPLGGSILSPTTAIFRWCFLRNPTLGGAAPLWVAVPDSAVESSLCTGTTITAPGIQLLSGYSQQSNDSNLNLALETRRWLGRTIAGVSDIIVLAVQRVSALAFDDFYGSVVWQESL